MKLTIWHQFYALKPLSVWWQNKCGIKARRSARGGMWERKRKAIESLKTKFFLPHNHHLWRAIFSRKEESRNFKNKVQTLQKYIKLSFYLFFWKWKNVMIRLRWQGLRVDILIRKFRGSYYTQKNIRIRKLRFFLPVQIRIWNSDSVETRETQKSGNEILSHCLSG